MGDITPLYLGNEGIRVLGAGSGVLLWMSLLIHSRRSPGPGRWRKQIGLGCGCSGAQQESGKRRGLTAQRGRSPVIPRALFHMRMGVAPLSGHTLESGAGHCQLECGGLSHP